MTKEERQERKRIAKMRSEIKSELKKLRSWSESLQKYVIIPEG